MADRPLVVLNQLGSIVNPALSAFGARLNVIDGTRAQGVPWEADGVDVLLTGPSPAWNAAPSVRPAQWKPGPRWVQIASTGVDGFPPWLLHDRIVTCGRGDAAVPIAEYVIAAMLLREKQLDVLRPDSPQAWLDYGSMARNGPLQGGLDRKVVGIAGYGAIGQAVAERCRAFGMRVLAWRRGSWPADEVGVEPVAQLEDLVARVDHLVLALPLTPKTVGCVNERLLARAKAGLHLVNVARGALVDNEALLAAIEAGRVAFATLDVTEPEPLPAGHVFYTHPAIRLTPHVSWTGPTVRQKLVQRVEANLQRFLDGSPLLDVVDAERGY